jgi:hypothetical protein
MIRTWAVVDGNSLAHNRILVQVILINTFGSAQDFGFSVRVK